MVHQRQRLPFRLKPGHHLLGVHAQLEDLEGDPTVHRLLLLRHPHDAEPALADLLQQLVAADTVAGFLRGCIRRLHSDRGLQERAGPLVGCQERIGPLPQLGVASAGLVKERGPLRRR